MATNHSFSLYCLLAALLLSAGALGQTSKGTIAGTVTDSTGAAVVGATVTAKASTGGESRAVTTGNNGEYHIEAINPGPYDLTVSASGFATVSVANYDVPASVVTPWSVRLNPGPVSETLLVEATSNRVQTETAELSATLPTVEIQELPIASLNPIALALTEPGVVRVSERDSLTNGVGFAVDGLRPRANNFLIDGFDNNDNGIAGQAIQPQNLEAVSEVSIQTNSYSSEYGRGGASLTNVIYAGGTNQYHGGIWERYGTGGFNAVAAQVPFRENTFGFKFGGPIVKEKLFIFGTSQWDRIRGQEFGAQVVLPTAAGVATLQSLSAGNTNVQNLLTSLGGAVAPQGDVGNVQIGNRPGCPACVVELGTFQRSPSQISNAYEYDVRADYVANAKDTVTVRWLGSYSSLTPDLFANSTALPGVDTRQSGPSRNLGVNWTHVVSERAVNELRFTAQQLNFGFDPVSATAASQFAENVPEILIAELTGSVLGGLAAGFPQDRNHLVFQYQDAFSMTKGHHTVKFGADIAHLGISDGLPFNSRGVLTYNAGGDCSAIGIPASVGCTGLANYIDDFSGAGGNATINFGISQVTVAQTQQAYYFQDNWKFRPNISLTYGLRYEYQGTPFNTLPFPTVNPNTALTDSLTLSVKQKPDRNNFGPRLGIAYTPHFWTGLFGQDKTAIRAGWGVFYDALFANILDNTASSTPNVTGGTVTGTISGNPGDRGQGALSAVIPSITPQLSPLDSVTTAVSNLRNPLTYQWNVNVERELRGNWLATVAYVGTRGERLFLNQELNPGVNGVRLNPDRGGIFARANHGDSIYHGLQLKAERRFTKGFLFRGAYTWSRSIDNGSEIFVTSGGSTRAQDQFSFRGDRGPSAFDREQRLALTWVYQIPGVGGDSGFGRALKFGTEGWQVSGTAQFESGAPETLHLGGADINGDLSGFNDRPSLGNPKVPINFSSACKDPNGTCDTGFGFSVDGVTFVDFFSSFGFDPVTGNFTAKSSDFKYFVVLGKNGNIGRNSFYNPGRQDWTLAVQREFKLRGWEQQAVLFRLEAFNPFNHANLGGGENNIPSVSGDLLSGTFLNTAVTRVGGRNIRLFAKYTF
jgi:outer membrane receptor protein involved in Fe transport